MFFHPGHLPFCPGPLHEWLNGGWCLHSSWPATSQLQGFLVAVLNTLVLVNVLQRCMTGSKTMGVGTQHTLWRLLFNRVISYAQADVPVICKQCPPRSSRDVLAVEVKDKIPPSTGDATLRLGIQVYLIRMSFAFPNWLNHFSRSSFPIHTTVNERRAMYSATWLKASHCRPTKIDD